MLPSGAQPVSQVALALRAVGGLTPPRAPTPTATSSAVPRTKRPEEQVRPDEDWLDTWAPSAGQSR
jgi:hypothetical protein